MPRFMLWAPAPLASSAKSCKKLHPASHCFPVSESLRNVSTAQMDTVSEPFFGQLVLRSVKNPPSSSKLERVRIFSVQPSTFHFTHHHSSDPHPAASQQASQQAASQNRASSNRASSNRAIEQSSIEQSSIEQSSIEQSSIEQWSKGFYRGSVLIGRHRLPQAATGRRALWPAAGQN